MATVAQLLGRKPRAIYSVTADAPVLEAIRLMAEHSVGALLVMHAPSSKASSPSATMRVR